MNRYENEANRAANAAFRGDRYPVVERTGSLQLQPFLGIDFDVIAKTALDFIAPKANAIAGFRMFTIVLGVNPINMSAVDRSPANILRALIELLPGGVLIGQALDNYGIIDKVGAFVADQIKALGLVGSSIGDALVAFVKSVKPTDIGDLDAVWERGKRIFTEPIDRIIDFAKGLIDAIIGLIKDAVLPPLAKLAEGTNGWDLLIAVLGKNPITGEAVPRKAETLIPGFLKLINQEEIWENMKKAKAIDRAWAWFQGALGGLMGFVNQIPGLAMAAFKSLEVADIVLLPRAFAKVAAVFGNFLGNFIDWAGKEVWSLLELIFEVVSPPTLAYLKKTGAALKGILKDPMPFVGNLVKAAKLGFENFGANFGTHLKAGLIDWLIGALPGVYIPKALSLVEVGKFVISVLGISWEQIRGKIVKALGPNGETIMKGLETTFDIVVALVKGGPAAAWEIIKEKLSDLKDQVIGGISDFVMDIVVKKAIPKLISMFIPGAGFISAIISIYDTIKVFIEKIAKLVQVVKGFVDSIVAIAGGEIGAAAAKVEGILGNLLSLAINFFAGFVGLDNVAEKILGVIGKIRASVDKAIDAAIAWIVEKAKALIAKLMGKKDGKPDERTEEQKNKDKLAAIADAEKLLTDKGFDEERVRGKLVSIKSHYRLLTLDLVVDSKKDQTETVHFTASASDKIVGDPKVVVIAESLKQVVLDPPFIAREKPPEGPKLAMTRKEFREQVELQEYALNQLKVKVWKQNWNKFYPPPGGGEGGRWGEEKAKADREAAISAEQARTLVLWMKNNPSKSLSDAEAFVTQLFERQPGNTAYPFKNKSLNSNGIDYINPVYGKAILHAVDQGAGGGAETVGLGGARENSSIGAQWSSGGLADKLKELLDVEIDAAVKISGEAAVDELKLNVKLPVKDG